MQVRGRGWTWLVCGLSVAGCGATEKAGPGPVPTRCEARLDRMTAAIREAGAVKPPTNESVRRVALAYAPPSGDADRDCNGKTIDGTRVVATEILKTHGETMVPGLVFWCTHETAGKDLETIAAILEARKASRAALELVAPERVGECL